MINTSSIRELLDVNADREYPLLEGALVPKNAFLDLLAFDRWPGERSSPTIHEWFESSGNIVVRIRTGGMHADGSTPVQIEVTLDAGHLSSIQEKGFVTVHEYVTDPQTDNPDSKYAGVSLTVGPGVLSPPPLFSEEPVEPSLVVYLGGVEIHSITVQKEDGFEELSVYGDVNLVPGHNMSIQAGDGVLRITPTPGEGLGRHPGESQELEHNSPLFPATQDWKEVREALAAESGALSTPIRHVNGVTARRGDLSIAGERGVTVSEDVGGHTIRIGARSLGAGPEFCPPEEEEPE